MFASVSLIILEKCVLIAPVDIININSRMITITTVIQISVINACYLRMIQFQKNALNVNQALQVSFAINVRTIQLAIIAIISTTTNSVNNMEDMIKKIKNAMSVHKCILDNTAHNAMVCQNLTRTMHNVQLIIQFSVIYFWVKAMDSVHSVSIIIQQNIVSHVLPII